MMTKRLLHIPTASYWVGDITEWRLENLIEVLTKNNFMRYNVLRNGGVQVYI